MVGFRKTVFKVAFKELHFSWALSIFRLNAWFDKRGETMSELMAYGEFKHVCNNQDKEDWTL